MKVTIKDVAREAGVSASTVSYALNKKGPVTKASHKRILDIVQKYGFVPNANARGLVTGLSNTIGLLINISIEETFSTPSFVHCIKIVANEVQQRMGTLSISFPNAFSADVMRGYLSNVNVDGIITLFNNISGDAADLMQLRHVPSILFEVRSENCSTVNCDDYLGCKLAFDHLISLGRKKILMLTGKQDICRIQAYRDGIRENLLSYNNLLPCGYDEQSSSLTLWSYLTNQGDWPDAILCGNDTIAYGVLKALCEHNIQVPEDISVVGYDDIARDRNESLGLTSVYKPFGEMMKAATDYIYKSISENNNEIIHLVYEPTLVIRKTTVSAR